MKLSDSTALSHLRVLDLSRILAGPWASQLLADLGAEVIKIERPGSGDDTRAWGPPYLEKGGGEGHGPAAYYLSCNRGKRSVTIDITTPEGQQLVRELAARSDVVIENFKVGGLSRYGLDYENLRELNSRLVYCSITGFGQNGPYAHRAGYDFLIQAMGGLMSITGEPDTVPGGGPVKVGVALADVLTGLYATVGILAALAHREQSGVGQYIDLALLDVQVASLANQAMNYLATGKAPGRMGNAHPNIVPYQAFKAADGHIVLTVGNDTQFFRFCRVADRLHWANDPRFATNAARVRHRDELIPLIDEVISQRTQAWWIAELEKVGVPCGPINDLEQVFDHPQIRHRGMRVSVEHPEIGEIPQVGNPIHLSETPVRYQHPPPLLGEHTQSVLREVLGVTEQEFTALRAKGVV
ncbi:MAG: CaiB/BaiF CoA-transferase family protein [Gammaproteobacteria bacterium]